MFSVRSDDSVPVMNVVLPTTGAVSTFVYLARSGNVLLSTHLSLLKCSGKHAEYFTEKKIMTHLSGMNECLNTIHSQADHKEISAVCCGAVRICSICPLCFVQCMQKHTGVRSLKIGMKNRIFVPLKNYLKYPTVWPWKIPFALGENNANRIPTGFH